MATEVKSLLVRVGADDSQLRTALGKTRTALKDHSAQFKKVGMGMTAAGGAIVGAMGLMVKSYVTAGDEVHKMSLRTGMSTEALSELKYAAELSGTSLATVEKGVKKMASSIGEAEAGVKTYTDAFALIGLEVEDLQGLSPEEQFMKMAAGIAEIEDPTKRAYAAQKLLGRAGTELLPLFGEGAEGMEKMREKAREMGLSISGPAAQGAANLGDAMTTLKGSLKGVTMSIAQKLAPIITSIAEKVSSFVTKIKAWMEAHPGLTKVIVVVVAVLGGLLAVLGPLVMILPALAGGVAMLGGAFSALLGPLGLIIAGVAAATIVFLKLKKAKDEVRKADERLVEAQKSLRQKLIDMKNAAGMTGEEFGLLTNKYKGNIVAMTMAIHKGKEGKKLQEALATVSKKHKEEIDKQRESYETIIPKVDEYKVKLQEVPGIVKAMTDEINKATLSEYEYAKLTLEQKKLDRDAAITKELEDQTARQEALKLSEEAHNVAMAELDDAAAEEKRLKREEQYLLYLESKQSLVDSINQMTLSELEYSKWALDQEYEKQKQHIENTVKNEEERNELLRLLREKYLLDIENAEAGHADKITKIQANTTAALTQLYGNFIDDTLDAFSDWGEGSENILKGIGNAFKNLARSAIEALKDIVKQELIEAAKTIIAEKAKAISKVITSVMALPFPANILAVGGAIAAVTLLFKKIKLFKEGGFVPKQTLAMLHPGEYVLNAPTVKALAGGGGGFILKQANYFYGDINNVGDMDEISKRLALQTRRAIEKGRK